MRQRAGAEQRVVAGVGDYGAMQRWFYTVNAGDPRLTETRAWRQKILDAYQEIMRMQV